MKKNDFVLIGVILAVALVLFLVINVFNKDLGEKVKVQVDGEVVATYDLNKNGEYKIETEDDGLNVLVIENGQAYVINANCPDGICINQGKISKNGESIICLPHKVVITVFSANEAETDAMAQ